MCLCMGFFGLNVGRFSTMTGTIMALFQQMVGSIFYTDMAAGNPSLAPIVFYIFMIMFFFIIMSFFSVR